MAKRRRFGLVVARVAAGDEVGAKCLSVGWSPILHRVLE
jgi:hypothetical protein